MVKRSKTKFTYSGAFKSRPCQRQEMARHFWVRVEPLGELGRSPWSRRSRQMLKFTCLSTGETLFNRSFLFFKIFLVFSAAVALGAKGLQRFNVERFTVKQPLKVERFTVKQSLKVERFTVIFTVNCGER
ncbi:hypothetical protein SXM_3971 [Shewanella xiamenensis]|nr:hypothetical protein SXM_3971 [Shewanella xiamenensis]